ncbi:MAG: hypothetical protein ACTSUF_06580 [Candidatus Heimdallarchaeaceae archaeon]
MMRIIKRKDRFIVLLIGIVISLILSNKSVQVIFSYNAEITKDNNQYPVYSVLTLKLNNATNGELQAQTQIFNQSINKWEDNQALFNLIQQDLDELPKFIYGLKQIILYDYNTSYLPGCVYLLLSPIELEKIGTVANATIDHILSNPTTWWYVADISIELLDLEPFLLTGLEDHTDEYITRLSIRTFLNYSIINNTLIIYYPQRNNLTASMNFFNGSVWLPNLEFFDYCNNLYTLINHQAIFQSHNVSITNFFCSSNSSNETLQNVIDENLLNKEGITPTISNTTTQTEINHMLYTTGSHKFCISYSPSLSHEEKIILYLTMYATIKHFWFTVDISPMEGYPSGIDSTSSSAFISVIAFLIITFAISTKRKRKHKLS